MLSIFAFPGQCRAYLARLDNIALNVMLHGRDIPVFELCTLTQQGYKRSAYTANTWTGEKHDAWDTMSYDALHRFCYFDGLNTGVENALLHLAYVAPEVLTEADRSIVTSSFRYTAHSIRQYGAHTADRNAPPYHFAIYHNHFPEFVSRDSIITIINGR